MSRSREESANNFHTLAVTAASERREFHPWVNLEETRKRIEQFCSVYTESGSVVEKLRKAFFECEEIGKYRNPQDVVDFCIGQILRVTC